MGIYCAAFSYPPFSSHNICPKGPFVVPEGELLRSPLGTMHDKARRQRALAVSLSRCFGFSPSPKTARALWPLWAALLPLAGRNIKRLAALPKGAKDEENTLCPAPKDITVCVGSATLYMPEGASPKGSALHPSSASRPASGRTKGERSSSPLGPSGVIYRASRYILPQSGPKGNHFVGPEGIY